MFHYSQDLKKEDNQAVGLFKCDGDILFNAITQKWWNVYRYVTIYSGSTCKLATITSKPIIWTRVKWLSAPSCFRPRVCKLFHPMDWLGKVGHPLRSCTNECSLVCAVLVRERIRVQTVWCFCGHALVRKWRHSTRMGTLEHTHAGANRLCRGECVQGGGLSLRPGLAQAMD